MKIVFVVPLINSYFAFLQELGATLHKCGHSVFLVTDNSLEFEIDDVCVYHIPFPRSMNLINHMHCSLMLHKYILELKPDIIHSHFSANIFTVALSKRRGWPYTIGTFHGMSYPLIEKKWKSFLIKKAELYAAKKMDKVCVLTEDDAEELKKNMDAGKVYKYSSYGVGCDIERFDPTRYSIEWIQEKKRQLGIKAHELVLIFIGRFTDFKGFGLLARSFLRLKQDKVKLLLVGKKDNLYSTGLCREEELAFFENPNIIDIGWIDNVEDYLAIADLTVFPSRREGMPVNVMESLVMGVPVIVANSRGSNVLISSENGCILPEFSVESLCDVIDRFKRFPSKIQYLSKNALNDRKKYSRLCYVEEQLNMYKTIIESV